jgi:hypothetical protein
MNNNRGARILFVQYCILPGRLFTQTLGRARMCVTNNVGCVLIMKIASFRSEREEAADESIENRYG